MRIGYLRVVGFYGKVGSIILGPWYSVVRGWISQDLLTADENGAGLLQISCYLVEVGMVS
jgi:hypothetical protein